MKINFRDKKFTEMRRLQQGLVPGEKPLGIGTVSFRLICPFGARAVIQNIKQVLLAFDNQPEELAPSQWEKVLPSWFISECVPEPSSEETDRWLKWWRTLPPDKQSEAESAKDWTLHEWLYWMSEDQREWFWWDASEADAGETVLLTVDASSWPFAWGALRWLAKASGASGISEFQPIGQ